MNSPTFGTSTEDPSFESKISLDVKRVNVRSEALLA